MMSERDLVVTPICLLILFLFAWMIRPAFTTGRTKRYFLPALTIKFVGALGLGLIYQFYYGGGDTFAYYKWGAATIFEAFGDSPAIGIKLLFADLSNPDPELYQYTSKMYYYARGGSGTISKIAGFFALLTFNTYSSIALCFAFFSFLGCWWLFSNVAAMYPQLTRKMAIAVFMLPSVIIWGSGLLKDSIVLGAVCFMVGSVICLFELKKSFTLSILFFILGLVLIFSIKLYVLLCLIPAIMAFVSLKFQSSIRNVMIKILIAPVVVVILAFSAYYGVQRIPAESNYAVDRISETAKNTANWHTQVSNEEEGSGYSLGATDYSGAGSLRLVIPAITAALFRPYIWEANGIFMLISALESSLFFFMSFRLVVTTKPAKITKALIKNPLLLSMLLFSLSFAFGIGLVTYNFGALVRYKIPLMPLYLIVLIVLRNFSSTRKRVNPRKNHATPLMFRP